MKSELLKIAIVTGSRAEYGLFKPLLKEIKKDRSLKLQLLVTGMHLSPEFGLTYKHIEADGYKIDEKVEMLLSADTDSSIVKSTALGMIGMADALERLKPDWLVVLGDRFETFAAVFAAHQAKIPVAHLHGGELTEGATDDAMRHAITKMSYLHFTSTEAYRKRVIQLGEAPKRVFNVGAIGLDSASKIKLLSALKLKQYLGIDINKKTILVTYHPVTMEKNTAEQQMRQLLKALEKFPNNNVVFTLPNSDADGRVIIGMIKDFCIKYPERSKAFISLGQLRYLSAIKHAGIVLGNSSSGIIEAPFFKIPTVNVGDRQKGRIHSLTVIHTGTSTNSICNGIKKAFSESFIRNCKKAAQPYGNGNSADKILTQIVKLGKIKSVKKSFFDLK